MPGLRPRRMQCRRVLGPTPPPTCRGAWHRARSTPARPPKTRSCPVPGLRPRRMQCRGVLGPAPPPTSSRRRCLAQVPGRPRRDRHRRDRVGARSTTPSNTKSWGAGSDTTSHVVEVPGTAPAQPRRDRRRRDPARCQVYDPVECSVVGCWVRHHLPRRREGGAWHRCPADPGETVTDEIVSVPGLRRRRIQSRGELDPTPPPTSSRCLAPRPVERCQVYDADECAVVGCLVRPHRRQWHQRRHRSVAARPPHPSLGI